MSTVQIRTINNIHYAPIKDTLLVLGYSRSSHSTIKRRATEGTITQLRTENGKKQHILVTELVKILPKLDRRDKGLESYLYRLLGQEPPTEPAEVIEQTLFNRDVEKNEKEITIELGKWDDEPTIVQPTSLAAKLEVEPQDIIELNTDTEGKVTVSGRNLHRGLMVETPYAKWIDRMINYGFEDGTDYIVTDIFVPNCNGGKQDVVEHILTLDMAKEIAMIQRSEQGKKVRQYFIQVEKDYNTPEKIMARALKIANKEMENLLTIKEYQDKQIEEMKPKALFAEAVGKTDEVISVGELSKFLIQNGVTKVGELKMGQNNLFEWLRDNKYLISRRGDSWNMPTQKAMDLKLFRIIERIATNERGQEFLNRKAMVTGKGQRYFIDKFLSLQGN